MTGTDYPTGKSPSPAWRKLLALGALLALVAVATRTARAQQAPVRIAAVEVHGCRTVSQDQVLGLLKTKPGREYNRLTVQDDMNTLYAKGWFKEINSRNQNTEDGRVIVLFLVTEHPAIVKEVIYKNAHHAKPEDLDGVTNVRKGMPLNPSQNLHACMEIQDYYRKKGRLFASVVLEEGGKAGDQRVVFNITEGGKVKIRKIRFTGNDTLASGARLKTQIDSKQPLIPGGGLLFGEYNPAVIDHDVLKLQEYYKTNGYLDAHVTREVVLNDDLRTVDVIFHIHEGIRYRVRDITVEGPKALDRDMVRGIVRVKQGDVYNEPAVEADLRNITDLYGYRGYGVIADKRLFADKEKDPGVVNVRYEVAERGPYKIGEIHIRGNTVTKDRVIRRVLQFYPGQVLSYPLLRQGEKDLARLNIFETNPEKGNKPTIVVQESDDPDNPYRNVDVIVQEQPTGSLMFGVGVNSNAGLMGSIVLNERNFDILRPPTSLDDIFNGRAWRGGGQEFRIEAVPGTQLQRYTVSFREPFLFDRPISLTTSAYYYQRLYNEYTEERIGTRITLGKQLNRFWSITGTARLEDVGISGVLPASYGTPPDLLNIVGHHILTGPRVAVIRDDRDSVLRPTEGGRIEAGAEEILGSYTFPQLTLEASRYFTTWQRPDGSGRHVIALRSQVGWTGANTPAFERFYAGGFNSLRGFQYRGVGPNINGFMVGGDFMFLNTIEYQIPIKANDQLYVVGFVDHGTVESSIEIRNYRVSVGVGLRITVPMLGPVPLALDLGFPLMSAASDRQQVFNFSVGVFR